MTSLPCTSAGNSALLRNYVTTYANHPNQLKINGAVLVSTFAGESCTFGASTVNQGWINTLKTNLVPTYFVPSFFVDPATFSTYSVIDGAFNVSCRQHSLSWAQYHLYPSGTRAGRREITIQPSLPIRLTSTVWGVVRTWLLCLRGSSRYSVSSRLWYGLAHSAFTALRSQVLQQKFHLPCRRLAIC